MVVLRSQSLASRPRWPLVLLLVLSAPLLGEDSCPSASSDVDGDDWTVDDGDCVDEDATIHPGASELCDGLDNNCDGRIDEGLEFLGYPDRDADGYGDSFSSWPSCTEDPGTVLTRGDCDDQDPSVHPGQADQPGDGIDQDCGGTDSAEPHVGFSSDSAETIDAALARAEDGDTVWVGPGIYVEHDISFQGKAVTLISTHLASQTRINASGQGTVMKFESGEGRESVLDGFTLTGGDASDGGGIFVLLSSPTIRNCTITDNWAFNGGGIYLEQSKARVEQCTLVGNSAYFGGGALLRESDGEWVQVTVSDNHAFLVPNASSGAGGGLYLDSSSPDITWCTMTRNHVQGDGGGMELKNANPTLSHCEFSENEADRGGGMNLMTSSPRLVDCAFTGNRADNGAGVYSNTSSPYFANCLLAGNNAKMWGGAMRLYRSSATVANCAILDNYAQTEGGGLALADSGQSSIVNTVLAFNAAYNVYTNDPEEQAPELRYSNLYSVYGPSHNLLELGDSNLTAEPGFVAYSRDMNFDNDDLHLTTGSPLVSTGDPGASDPDGSRADIGLYGGGLADWTYYHDGDEDGLFDGWEQTTGLDPSKPDGDEDPDRDGLTNQDELREGTLPLDSDTDGDNATDSNEIAASSDPTDWYSQPNPSPVARVPDDFLSIGSAIDAIVSAGEIEVGPGIWSESLEIQGKVLTIRSSDGAQATVIASSGGPALTGILTNVTLQGLTITGGDSDLGGGLRLEVVDGALTDLVITGNTASRYGGGVYLRDSPVAISRSTFLENTCGERGGGLYVEQSDPSIDHCVFEGNVAEWGGGLFAQSAGPVVTQTIFRRNEARYDNMGAGGAVYASFSEAAFQQCVFEDNFATTAGGALYLTDASIGLSSCSLTGNWAGSEGGGIYVSWSSPSISQCVLTGNTAALGGGIALYGSDSNPTITNSILAYNTVYNLVNTSFDPYYASNPEIGYSNLYARPGQENHNLAALPPSNTTGEPGLLSYDELGLPSDLHLAMTSSLIDAGDPSIQDPDGSRSDPGLFGGPGGDQWDLDGDSAPNYFWPGFIGDAPAGFSPADYDCDDLDPSTQSCL